MYKKTGLLRIKYILFRRPRLLRICLFREPPPNNQYTRSKFRIHSVLTPGLFLLSKIIDCRRIGAHAPYLARPPPTNLFFVEKRIDLKEFVKMQQYGKYYITLKGVHYEVSQEVHDAFYQAERQERYMAEKDQSHNLVILNISGINKILSVISRRYGCSFFSAISWKIVLISRI